ncbi:MULTISPECIES: CHAD domain-containing protein [unclassified Streptomyces]|uniref:CHAD domain-containing protein n=1 Tax=unclassified Streptomyces TaxID=2593676 RepID=UPI001BE57CBF|nr:MULTISPECIES: CHAD domain-containing protein [unclassified Streptomyces]MBT2405268.1 CHAD domain-containing protein [Streptomyces sp. ISL-21]MBT2457905.1 CHAD domain-containing protein [Streptomyces sp. ISL-86]MBT2613471.1 CHAD domain-containing protein [Streptomyces sp. ISL-87]
MAGTAGDVLGTYLRAQATAFLRAMRLHDEGAASGADAAEGSDAARSLRGAARRISGSLATFRVVTESAWADALRTELVWLSSTLADEHAYAARLQRLMEALHRLSGSPELPAPRGTAGSLTVGSARAGALLERQLTLARTRAHSATLSALGSSRFHAVADAVAVLASEVPLDPVAARGRIPDVLIPLAEVAESRLTTAISTLPSPQGTPYSPHEDGAWHEVRRLLRVHRYAREALGEDVTRLAAAGEALDRHRDAAEAAAASATAARTPRIAPATAYALGVLHADQRHEVEASRTTFQTLWHPVPAP